MKKKTVLPELLTAVHDTAAAQPQQDSIANRVRVLNGFARKWLRPASKDEASVAERLQDCLEAVVHADRGEVTGERFVQELEAILLTRGVELLGQTHGGVNVVTFAHALAYPARYLHMLGLADGMVPGRGPSDADSETSSTTE